MVSGEMVGVGLFTVSDTGSLVAAWVAVMSLWIFNNEQKKADSWNDGENGKEWKIKNRYFIVAAAIIAF